MPLRSGLTAVAARRTAQLLRQPLSGDAVAITDTERVLAFVGPGADHHTVGDPPQTEASARVLTGGKTVVVRLRERLGCPVGSCPLQSAVVAPLMTGKRIVGTLKVYRVDAEPPARDLVEGMAGILSLHLELADLDRERNLAADAKLDALRAQINPHFLFNILNTIASKARDRPGGGPPVAAPAVRFLPVRGSSGRGDILIWPVVISTETRSRMSRTLIDVDDGLLARSQEILGTSTKKETVNAALRELVRRAAAEDFLALGRAGRLRDAADPDVMAGAWR